MRRYGRLLAFALVGFIAICVAIVVIGAAGSFIHSSGTTPPKTFVVEPARPSETGLREPLPQLSVRMLTSTT